jgi:hypothetical protein
VTLSVRLQRMHPLRGVETAGKLQGMTRLAFYTFGLMREEHTHPHNDGFWERSGPIFDLAATADGCIWLDRGPGTASPAWSPPGREVNSETLSVWRDLVSVYRFSYSGAHAESLRHRSEWFDKQAYPEYVAWWIPDDHLPTWEEAARRLEHLSARGPTPQAFHFKAAFDAGGEPLAQPTMGRP